MRKSLAAFGLVFALLAGFFGYTVVEALDAQDAVSFTVERPNLSGFIDVFSFSVK